MLDKPNSRTSGTYEQGDIVSYLPPSKRNSWIVNMLFINIILWSIMCVGLMITTAATLHPIPFLFSAAFGVGAWWMKRLMMDFHADQDHDDKPSRLFRSHKRHANE